jgi:hypothetical protein
MRSGLAFWTGDGYEERACLGGRFGCSSTIFLFRPVIAEPDRGPSSFGPPTGHKDEDAARYARSIARRQSMPHPKETQINRALTAPRLPVDNSKPLQQ